MAKENEKTTTESPKTEPPVTVTLDRTYIHDGKYIGPGVVEVSASVAADLGKASERIKATEAESVDSQVAEFNAAEKERRELAEKTGRR